MDSSIVLDICSYLLLHKSCYSNVLNDSMPERNSPLPTIPSDSFVSTSLVHVPLLFELVPLLYKSKLTVSFYPMMCAVKQGRHACFVGFVLYALYHFLLNYSVKVS